MDDSFTIIVSLWPTHSDLAADLNGLRPSAAVAVSTEAVKKWRARNSVPPEWWGALVEAAMRRGFPGISLERMASIASARLERKSGVAA